MKDVYFDSIDIENTRGLSEMQMLFPVGKFNAIVGKNGHGKSTIPKSITMAAYGTDDEGNNISDFVNRKVGKNLEIIFKFRVVDKDVTESYEIKLYQNHSKFHNKFLLMRNGVDISGKTKTETYSMIENILIPYNVFKNTVIFSQQIKDFFTALTNSGQKSIFNSILNLDIWLQRYKKVDVELKKLYFSIEDINNEILTLKATLPENEKMLQMLELKKKEKIDELSKSKMSLIESIMNLEKNNLDLEENKKQLQSKLVEVDKLKNNVVVLQSQQTTISDKLSKFDETIKEKRTEKETEINREFEIIISKKILDINAKFDNDKNKLNHDLNIVMTELVKISDRFSTVRLETDKYTFVSEKQKESRIVTEDLRNLEIEYSTSDIETEKFETLSRLNDKKQGLISQSELIKNSGINLKKVVEQLTEDINTDHSALNKEISICSKCGQPLGEDHKKKVKKDIEDNKIKLDNFNKDLQTTKEKFEDIKKEIISFTEEIKKKEEDYNQLIIKKKTEKNQKIDILRRKSQLLTDEMQSYSEIIDEKISKLKDEGRKESSIINQKKEDIQESLIKMDISKSKEIKLVSDENEKECYNRKLEQIKKLLSQFSSEKEKLQFSFTELDGKIKGVQNILRSLEEVQQQINEHDKVIFGNKENIEGKKQQIKEIDSFIYDDTQINSIKILIGDQKNKLYEIENKTASTKREIKILEFWKEAYSDAGIKSMLIDSAIPFMNKVVRDELEKVSHGKFIVSFDTLSETKAGDVRDKFKVNVLNCENGCNDHKYLSGGEKRLIDLCCMKALRALMENLFQKRFHITVFDEALDALDDDNSSMFCRLMKQMSSDQNITIITHKMIENLESDLLLKL